MIHQGEREDVGRWTLDLDLSEYCMRTPSE